MICAICGENSYINFFGYDHHMRSIHGLVSAVVVNPTASELLEAEDKMFGFIPVPEFLMPKKALSLPIKGIVGKAQKREYVPMNASMKAEVVKRAEARHSEWFKGL